MLQDSHSPGSPKAGMGSSESTPFFSTLGADGHGRMDADYTSGPLSYTSPSTRGSLGGWACQSEPHISLNKLIGLRVGT